MTGRQALLSAMRQDAARIFYHGLGAVDPEARVHACCRIEDGIFWVRDMAFDLSLFEKIIVLGAGKAGAPMAKAVENIFKDRITDGRVIVKTGHALPLKSISLVEAAHPVPDENGVKGAESLFELALQADEKTLAICLLSGGGSSLLSLPADGLTLADKQETTGLLLKSGADIHDINIIRKHLSKIKGGQLAKAIFPATLVCLVLSDVAGDDFSTIASGPCTADPGTFDRCLDIAKEKGLLSRLPQKVLEHLKKGASGLIPETPKPGDPIFSRVTHSLIACNMDFLKAARIKAESLGYHSLILSSGLCGDTRDAAAFHAAIAKETAATGHPVLPPACILSGGETTVAVKGKGKGGRNQEFALASALHMKGEKSIVILSAGTDGTDGPTDAAGAFADPFTVDRALGLGLNVSSYLEDNNSYELFDRLSDLFITGPTRTNVMDARIILIR